MTGDGELQEGQNWEALQPRPRTSGSASSGSIVDRNELQSDKPTEEILALGDLEAKLRAFGWHVETVRRPRPRGAARGVRALSRRAGDGPKVARRAHDQGQGRLVHGASRRARATAVGRTAGTPARPTTRRSRARIAELVARIASAPAAPTSCSSPSPPLEEPCRRLEGEPRVGRRSARPADRPTSTSPRPTARRCSSSSRERSELVVLDADLASDCRIRGVRARAAGPLRRGRDRRAGHGLDGRRAGAPGPAAGGQLVRRASSPRARTSRSTTRRARARRSSTRCHYAGLIPAGPGKSHQSIRDISLLAALPNVTIVQPANAEETHGARCAGRSRARTRTSRSGSRSARRRAGSSFPATVASTPGRGSVLREGDDALLFAYGPVMLHEALTAAEALRRARRRCRS